MNESRRFNGLIGPANLLGLVRNTAPFLFTGPGPASAPASAAPAAAPGGLHGLADHPLGWHRILLAGASFAPSADPSAAQRVDYFALCLACHFATVATFIPTDVDAKVRGVLWDTREERPVLHAMAELTLAAARWDVAPVSARLVDCGALGVVSGHNGEWLGAACGALGCFLAIKDDDYAERLHGAVTAEVERGAAAFRAAALAKDDELAVLRLATVLTHNAGDIDQGLSFWRDDLHSHPYHRQLGRLAHENATAFAGTYQLAAALYKQLMAAEGHRNYPLRAVKALRASRDLLLPISPLLDHWGETIAGHPDLTSDERAEVVAALVTGCKKIPGQSGYYRALSGIEQALGGLDQLARRMPGGARALLKDSELRRAIAVKRSSFESMLRKRTAALLSAARLARGG
jgi:hypothetical protein